MLNSLLPVLLGYLIGSIPFGVIISRLAGVDIRKVGSGNIGATNIYRSLGVIPASLVFLLDLLKGTASIYLAQLMLPASPPLLSKETFIVLSGLAAVIGHMFPLYLGFKGGKGAATSLGVLAGIAPDLFLIALIYVAIAIAVTRYVSVASITGVILLSILMFAYHKPIEYSIATAIVALLVIYKHIPNIRRLMAGTESKIWGNK